MKESDFIFLGILFGGLALYIIIGVIRMAIDPEYERKVRDEAARAKARRNKNKKCSAYHDWRYYAAKNGFGPKDYK